MTDQLPPTRTLICDSCSALDPRWEHACRSFEWEPTPLGTHGSFKAWLFCDRCHDLVEADQVETLALVSRDALLELQPGLRPFAAELLQACHETQAPFWANRTRTSAVHLDDERAAKLARFPATFITPKGAPA